MLRWEGVPVLGNQFICPCTLKYSFLPQRPTPPTQNAHPTSFASPVLAMPSCTPPRLPFPSHTLRFPSDLCLPRTESSPHSYFLLQEDSSRLPEALSGLQTTSLGLSLFPASVPYSFTPTNPRHLSSPLRLAAYAPIEKNV